LLDLRLVDPGSTLVHSAISIVTVETAITKNSTEQYPSFPIIFYYQRWNNTIFWIFRVEYTNDD